jgi:hypothetical protein
MSGTNVSAEPEIISVEQRLAVFRAILDRVSAHPNDATVIADALNALLTERIDQLDHDLGGFTLSR